MSDLNYTIYYRNWHDDSPEHADLMSRRIETLLRPLLKDNVNQPAIDIGCGMGFAYWES